MSISRNVYIDFAVIPLDFTASTRRIWFKVTFEQLTFQLMKWCVFITTLVERDFPLLYVLEEGLKKPFESSALCAEKDGWKGEILESQ